MQLLKKLLERDKIIPVILTGGSGKRLWPLSQKKIPKTFLSLVEYSTLLQTTLARITKLPNISTPLVIGNNEHSSIIVKQCKEIGQDVTVLLEAEPHNTAPAAAMAAMYSMKQNADQLLLILPADHDIPDSSLFSKMIVQATKMANQGKLVVFGVTPSYPATAYGYIKTGEKLLNCWAIQQYKEKPSLKIATSYLKSKKFYWNSGIFLFRASIFLQELQKHSPKVYNSAEDAVQNLHVRRNFIRLGNMKNCPNISIDKAIFEKTKQAVMFRFAGEWHDLGCWESLYALGKKDSSQNVKTKNVFSFNSKGCFLYTNQQILVTSGINQCIVIVTPNAVLVSRRDKKQDLKKIVNYLLKNDYIR